MTGSATKQSSCGGAAALLRFAMTEAALVNVRNAP